MLKRLRAERNKKGNKKGFTLVELLIVIAILGIMIAVLVPTMMSGLDRAKQTEFMNRQGAIKTELDGFIGIKTVADDAALLKLVAGAGGAPAGVLLDSFAQEAIGINKIVNGATIATADATTGKTLLLAPAATAVSNGAATWAVTLTGIKPEDLGTAKGLVIGLPRKLDGKANVTIAHYATVLKKNTVVVTDEGLMTVEITGTTDALITIKLAAKA